MKVTIACAKNSVGTNSIHDYSNNIDNSWEF